VTLVIAHRGASNAERENTVPAFEAAARFGADWVELDVRRTADAALAVHHDGRLADGRWIVQTAARDLPDWVPSLGEAVEACAGMGVNIEIKNLPGERDHDEGLAVATAVAEWVGAQGRHDRVLVSSFHFPDIDRVRAVDAGIPTAWLVFAVGDAAAVVDRTAGAGHQALHPHVTAVDDELLAACRAAGLRVNTWTVDDPDLMRRLVDQAIDGIVTNVPDVGRRVVDEASR
jgi:glycerophosphoryl diester phosphodiesterase